MWEILFWLYLFNFLFLVIHEIDSAYWKEWELFGMKGGITLFLLLHFPPFIILLWGLRLVLESSFFGLIISLVLSAAGTAGFIVHMGFIARGHKEFKTPMSIFILSSMLAVSIAQAVITIIVLSGYPF